MLLRRTTLSLLALSLLVLVMSVGMASAQVTSSSPGGEQPGEQVQGDGDNSRGSINFLLPDTPFAEVLAPGETAILFAFDGSAGDVVSVTATQDTDALDPYIVVMGPRGEVLGYDDDSGEKLFSSAVTDLTLSANGSYLVLVSDYIALDSDVDPSTLTEERPFEVLVTGNNAPIGDPNYSEDSVIIFHGNIEVGGVTEGYSSAEEPIFYYFLEANAGDQIDILIDEADFDTLMMLFDRSGRRSAINDDDSERGGLESAIRGFEASETGSYLLFVTAYRFYTSADKESTYTGGNFTLSASQAAGGK
ncbi:MAG: hypothetical protein IPK19_13430 [Chloroflexi bacterium]|nr:hypothetical protein [Chloroflexota bacterium]